MEASGAIEGAGKKLQMDAKIDIAEVN